jgi:hypothetical protein
MQIARNRGDERKMGMKFIMDAQFASSIDFLTTSSSAEMYSGENSKR